jgi:hypothetical protein
MSPSDEFVLSVGWFGEIDKPRREAVLASPSRAGAIAAEPLVGVATISRTEFDAAIDAIRARGLQFADGSPTTELDAYAAVAEDGGRVSHASLGFDDTTSGHIEAIASALAADHRTPLEAVLEQVRVLVGSA